VSWESGEEKWSSRLYEPYPRTTLHYSGDLRKVIGNIYLSIFQLPPEDEDEHWWVKWFNFPTYLSAFEIATGKLLWQLESRNLICPPIAVSDNMIYVRVVGLRKHHGVVYALELQK
jgi:outer membrane protein assembly factor BamB